MKGMPESPDPSSRRPVATFQPFTTEMAKDMGISTRQLRGRRFRRVMHGVFIDHRVPDSLPVRTRSALLVSPGGGTASHLTAACLWAANAQRTGHIHLSYRQFGSSTRHEIKIHRFTYPLDTSSRHGIQVTSPGMTFMHLAVVLDLVQLTAFGDMLVKRKVITPDELIGYALAWSHHGAHLGSLAASYVRGRVDSVPESNLRMLLVLAGLPEPTVNFPILRPNGEERYRLDLAYPEIMLAIEYDGRWHDDPEQAAKDEVRRSWLRRQGWTVIVVKASDLYENANLTVERIAAELSARGILLGPRRHDYQRYFGPVLASEDDPFWGPSQA